MSVQSTIEAAAAALPPSERRVADAIRANPSLVLTHTINELAEASQTSIATVVRFCRAVGLSGYSQLRMRLATELGKEAAQFGPTMSSGADIRPDDSLAEVVAKISGLEKLAIDETRAALDVAQLDRLGAALDEAPFILTFGMGASHFVAQDLQHKLIRIDHNSSCPHDSHEAWAQAALAVPGTVAIAFSHSGETAETLRFLALAQQQGATTVAVTSVPDSALAALADEVVLTVARDTSLRAGAMVSRIAQLLVVDVLFLALARRHYADTVGALQLASRAILGRSG